MGYGGKKVPLVNEAVLEPFIAGRPMLASRVHGRDKTTESSALHHACFSFFPYLTGKSTGRRPEESQNAMSEFRRLGESLFRARVFRCFEKVPRL